LLSDSDIERFARQIVVPDVGARGQERICASTVCILGDPVGAGCAEVLARATGFRTVRRLDDEVACILVAGIDNLASEHLAAVDRPTFWYEVTSGGLRFGSRAPGDSTAAAQSGEPGSADPLLHSLGAAELVSTAVAFVLGWQETQTRYTLGPV
jgi:hypothetical protein